MQRLICGQAELLQEQREVYYSVNLGLDKIKFLYYTNLQIGGLIIWKKEQKKEKDAMI